MSGFRAQPIARLDVAPLAFRLIAGRKERLPGDLGLLNHRNNYPRRAVVA